MVLPGLPEQPITSAADALNNYLNTTGAGALGGGSAGLMTARPITDPGNGGTIDVSGSGYLDLTHTSGSETRTLPAPSFVGQEIIIYLGVDLDSYGGSIDVDSATSVAGGSGSVIFDAVGQCVIYYAVTIGGVLRWRIERALNNVPGLAE